ncbi:MAG: preprotein translocase subunit SecE [Candidatus Hydrogenedentes bacterium]|nr:preprotein translocase subunit SecE [Candidatus Hydrogenedentota bacterium]
MAKAVNATMSNKVNPLNRMREFLQEVKVEMSKVAWPSKDELKSSTQIVLLMLFVVMAIIFVYDTIFSKSIFLLLKLG